MNTRCGLSSTLVGRRDRSRLPVIAIELHWYWTIRRPTTRPAARQALDVPQFLRIAIPLAAACRQMHERGLIHKDIKPANVLVDASGDGIWLTG
jgi:serine/threonine protein kinase